MGSLVSSEVVSPPVSLEVGSAVDVVRGVLLVGAAEVDVVSFVVLAAGAGDGGMDEELAGAGGVICVELVTGLGGLTTADPLDVAAEVTGFVTVSVGDGPKSS